MNHKSCYWLAFLTAVGGAASFAETPAHQIPEIRRVLLNPDQIPAELEKVQRGALQSLPLNEFEEILRRAERSRWPDAASRLVSAKYHCRLQCDDLVGAALWTMRHSDSDPTSFRLTPFSLAIRQARWSDYRPAIIVNSNGLGTGL